MNQILFPQGLLLRPTKITIRQGRNDAGGDGLSSSGQARMRLSLIIREGFSEKAALYLGF